MKTSIPVLLLIILVTSAAAQQIPGIQQQPQWAMPFYFEDANGERDTVWVGYDPSAKSSVGYDPDFEIFKIKDTISFQAVLFPGHPYPVGSWSDSVKRVEVTSYNRPNISLGFINGKMPITMKWENSMFYSNSLPYPDISPRPRARANLDCANYEMGYSYCYTPSPHPSFVLTDYNSPEFQITQVYSDSFYFDGSGNITAEKAIGVHISIVPHTQPPVGIKNTAKLYADVYPNPFTDVVHIAGIVGRYETTVQDVTGRIVTSSAISLHPGEAGKLDLSYLPQGIYFLSIKNSTSQVTKKIIK